MHRKDSTRGLSLGGGHLAGALRSVSDLIRAPPPPAPRPSGRGASLSLSGQRLRQSSTPPPNPPADADLPASPRSSPTRSSSSAMASMFSFCSLTVASRSCLSASVGDPRPAVCREHDIISPRLRAGGPHSDARPDGTPPGGHGEPAAARYTRTPAGF